MKSYRESGCVTAWRPVHRPVLRSLGACCPNGTDPQTERGLSQAAAARNTKVQEFPQSLAPATSCGLRQPALQPLGNTPLGEGGSHGKVGSFTRFRAFVPPARVSTELVVQIAPSAFGPGASQFLSRRSVLKEQSKIARHFNAGKGLEKSSPAGTVEKKRRFRSSLRDWMAIPSDPGVQTPGYFQNVPAGRSFSVVQKLRCALSVLGFRLSLASSCFCG